MQPIVQVDGRKIGTAKVGNPGGSGAISARRGSGVRNAPPGGNNDDDSGVDD